MRDENMWENTDLRNSGSEKKVAGGMAERDLDRSFPGVQQVSDSTTVCAFLSLSRSLQLSPDRLN
jgi:hypothetical protein